MESLVGEYGWLFLTGIIALLFQSTIQEAVSGGSKLVVANSKLKDLKIEKPLPNLDLSKYDTE
jgi:hypothetical protein